MLLCLLFKLMVFFLLLIYMLEIPKLTPFTLQLNQAVFYALLLSDQQRTKPVSHDIQLWGCGIGHLENRGQHLFWDVYFIMYSNWALELPFKKWTFSLSSGWQSFERLTPCSLCLMNNKPYFLFLRALLSLFVIGTKARGPAFQWHVYSSLLPGHYKMSTLLSTMMPCFTTDLQWGGQVTVDWNLWNNEPKINPFSFWVVCISNCVTRTKC
jgi:hypothetical protein